MIDFLITTCLSLRWWVVTSLLVNAFYGVHLLYSRRSWGRELSGDAIDGLMIVNILLGPLWLFGLACVAILYPWIVYAQGKRERKRMYRTPYQER